MVSPSTTTTRAMASAGFAEKVHALAAAALGLLIIGMVGFSHLDAVHNAAHDVRHSNAFPCH
jgi:cobalt transporter subunit CbtB